MNYAALISIEEKCVVVPTSFINARLYSVQAYAERFLNESIIIPAGPGEIELNLAWDWRFVLDATFIDSRRDYSLYTQIPYYRFQQH